ncbi:MAG TPA: hypothetical protein VGJ21_09480 [Terracidiphilus sp.]|jgi:hypothetical protein
MEVPIAADEAAGTLLECPKCKETIDSSAGTCQSCDAANLARVNKAIHDSKHISTLSLALPVFLVLRFVPFFPLVGGTGFLILSLMIPIWALLWWKRYAKLSTGDSSYRTARAKVKICGIVGGLVLLFLVVLPFVVTMILYLTGVAHLGTVAQ